MSDESTWTRAKRDAVAVYGTWTFAVFGAMGALLIGSMGWLVVEHATGRSRGYHAALIVISGIAAIAGPLLAVLWFQWRAAPFRHLADERKVNAGLVSELAKSRQSHASDTQQMGHALELANTNAAAAAAAAAAELAQVTQQAQFDLERERGNYAAAFHREQNQQLIARRNAFWAAITTLKEQVGDLLNRTTTAIELGDRWAESWVFLHNPPTDRGAITELQAHPGLGRHVHVLTGVFSLATELFTMAEDQRTLSPQPAASEGRSPQELLSRLLAAIEEADGLLETAYRDTGDLE